MRPKAEFPAKLACLFKPKRYKVFYGGRGGTKSWGMARALLIKGAKCKLRILCAREIQKSISESVHKLICDQIEALSLQGEYTIYKDSIRGKNGTEFFFAGLRHNIDNIKSKEGIDIVWVEEAQTVSKTSWDKLIPTIRKENSEIWISFNPELDTDETYCRFVLSPPSDSFVVKVNWRDNPWFPDVLKVEKDDCRARSEDEYLHIWEGNCKAALEGAVYIDEIRRATKEGRITKVPYDPAKPVHTFWDLGWSDCVSIWCCQMVGLEFRVIDFMQDRHKPASWYIAELQKKPYAWGVDWLPHDGKAATMAAEGRTIQQQIQALGRTVEIVPNMAIADGINAARTIFDRCWFDESKCAEGLDALRRYRFEVNPDTGQYSKNPKHDEYSHAADAFRYMGLAMTETKKKQKIKYSTKWVV